MFIRDITLKKNLKKIVISIIIVILLITLSIYTGIFSILRQILFYPIYLFSAIGSGMHNTFSTIGNLSNVSKENTTLKKQLKQLEVKIQSFDEIQAENARLRKFLNLEPVPQYEKGYGWVIGHSPDSWHNQVIINIGSSKGIKINTPVINSDGLIGRVISYSYSTSTVRLLTDRNSAVSCRDVRSRHIGIAVGGFFYMGKLQYLQQFADIKANDDLITSGLGGIFPKDIPVGKIVKVEKPPGELSVDVDIKFKADFNRLEEIVALIQK